MPRHHRRLQVPAFSSRFPSSPGGRVPGQRPDQQPGRDPRERPARGLRPCRRALAQRLATGARRARRAFRRCRPVSCRCCRRRVVVRRPVLRVLGRRPARAAGIGAERLPPLGAVAHLLAGRAAPRTTAAITCSTCGRSTWPGTAIGWSSCRARRCCRSNCWRARRRSPYQPPELRHAGLFGPHHGRLHARRRAGGDRGTRAESAAGLVARGDAHAGVRARPAPTRRRPWRRSSRNRRAPAGEGSSRRAGASSASPTCARRSLVRPRVAPSWTRWTWACTNSLEGRSTVLLVEGPDDGAGLRDLFLQLRDRLAFLTERPRVLWVEPLAAWEPRDLAGDAGHVVLVRRRHARKTSNCCRWSDWCTGSACGRFSRRRRAARPRIARGQRPT